MRDAMKALEEVRLEVKDREAIEAAGRLLRERFPVDQVVLFGSKARNEADDESDIDLLVLTRGRMSWDEKSEMTRALGSVQRQYSVIFSPVVISSRDWAEGPYIVLPFRGEVNRDGVVV